MDKEATAIQQHLDWSKKQSHILTCGEQATRLYCADRGFPFTDDELPHHFLTNGRTRHAFERWKQEGKECHLICGAWERCLFVGGWEYSTARDEITFNVQTKSLFVDLRIPRSKSIFVPKLRSPGGSSLSAMNDEELRMFARQHVFSGYTILSRDHLSKRQTLEAIRPVCTRHHCIDWNFVSVPRPVPNKWFVEMHSDCDQWKELSFATDDSDQHYYMEQWRRLEGDDQGQGVVLALRKAKSDRDGVLVVVGDHFNFVFGRTKSTSFSKQHSNVSSVVELVDSAIARSDRATAEAYLSIDGGHGRVQSGWLIDCAIQPWKEGTCLLSNRDNISLVGTTLSDCYLLWNGEKWDVFECSFRDLHDLTTFFRTSTMSNASSRL